MVETFVQLRNDGRRITHHVTAALASLGCPVRTQLLHAYDGKRPQQRSFFVAPVKQIMVRASDGNRSREHHVLALWRAGKLATIDPHHPFLDALRALENLRLIREAAAGRIRSLCLTLEPALGKTPRTRYAEGAEIPSLLQQAAAIVHEDRRVAALGMLGVPLQAVQRERFILGRAVDIAGAVNPAGILQQYNAGTLPPHHPFVVGLRACETYDEQCRHLEAETGTVIVRPQLRVGETNPRRAFIDLNATGDVHERINRFIETGH